MLRFRGVSYTAKFITDSRHSRGGHESMFPPGSSVAKQPPWMRVSLSIAESFSSFTFSSSSSRPLHGPEGGEPARTSPLAGGAFRGGPCSLPSSPPRPAPATFFGTPGEGFRAAQLHLPAARHRHDPRAQSRQLHLHQALLRLQSFLDLRIPDRPLRHAHEERRFRRFHDSPACLLPAPGFTSARSRSPSPMR